MRTTGRKTFRTYSTVDERAAAKLWHQATARGPCVMCRAFRPSTQIRRAFAADITHLEGHHVLSKRHLKLNGRRDALWDIRNGICLCRYHHERHEKWRQRVPRNLLPADAFEFAAELDLTWLLDREHPEAA